MQSLVSRLAVVGFAGFAFLGCASQAAENRRLLDELSQARAAAVDNRAHLAELEQRLLGIEQQRELEAERARARELIPLVEKLDLLISQNRELLMQNAASLPAEPAPTEESDGEESAAAEQTCELSSDPKQQLRYWAERLRGDPSRWRGGLSAAENQAVNVLLRRERLLDPRNPWHVR
jgi:hypothetical protein